MVCYWRLITLCMALLPVVLSAPVKPNAKDGPEEKREGEDDQATNLEYDRYLREVVSILESDPTFKKKLEEANITDIKSGKIARHLELVQHGYRSQLDEIKRKEIDRLKKYHKQQVELNNVENLKIPEHIDHRNSETFEEEDLRKLILKATADLDAVDTKRKEEFKEYEMEKEHERREKLKAMNEEQRKAEEKRMEELKKKHADHPKINHPGSKDQLNEVWEEGDGMKGEEFDPKTFFNMHDTNGDGAWDPIELEALFERELEKSFDEKKPEEDDPVEKEENRQRMREHVLKEIDTNKDHMVSLEEFLKSANNEDFDNKEEWKDVEDEEKFFTDDEFDEFEKENGYEDLDEHGQVEGDGNDIEETNEIFTDEEFAAYEKMLAEQESKHKEFLDGHAQPGEVNVPHPGEHQQPPVVSDSHPNQQPQDHAGQAQGHEGQAQGQEGKAQPHVPNEPQGHQPEQPAQGQQQEHKEGTLPKQ